MVVVAGLFVGVVLGLVFPGFIPRAYTLYVAVALLAAFDSIIGAVLAKVYNKFSTQVFLSGFVLNTALAVMLTFMAGAVIGITTFSRVLSFALRRFHDATIALLSGFMLGSLNKVWPWKETIETYTDSHGVVKPLVEQNIAPNTQVIEAVGLMILGFTLVYALEKLSTRKGA